MTKRSWCFFGIAVGSLLGSLVGNYWVCTVAALLVNLLIDRLLPPEQLVLASSVPKQQTEDPVVGDSAP